MKKILLLIIFLSAGSIYAQEYSFGVITDVQYSLTHSNQQLPDLVDSINQRNDFSFLIIAGNLTKSGDEEELFSAYNILNRLKMPYYFIPGRSDIEVSQTKGIIINEVFSDDKFVFEFEDDIYIGLNSVTGWDNNRGHISPEDLYWLEDELSYFNKIDEVYLFTYHPLEKIDNWFELTSILSEHNLIASFDSGRGKYEENNFYGIPQINIHTNDTEDKNFAYVKIQNSNSDIHLYDLIENNLIGAQDKIFKVELPVSDSLNTIPFNCEIIWEKDFNSTFCAEPIFYADKFYIADKPGIVSCIDTTGKLIWDYDAFGNVVGSPAASDNILAIGTAQGDLITLNARSGESIQTIGLDGVITSSLEIIKYAGNKKLLLPKFTRSKSAVIIGTSSGKLFCYDLETLQEYWVNNDAKGMISGKPQLTGNKIIYSSYDGFLYCIDAREGWMIWKWKPPQKYKTDIIKSRIAINGQSVFVAGSNGTLFAVDLNLGKTNWTSNRYKASNSVAVSRDNKYVLLKSRKDNIYKAAANSGKENNLRKIGFGKSNFPNEILTTEYGIIFGNDTGEIFRIDEKNKYSKILFMGISPINSIIDLGNGRFAASNIDGKFLTFNLK